MGTIVRAGIVLIGALQLVMGVATVGSGRGEGLWLMAVGAFLVVVPLIERQRYRSEEAERATAPIGPGGGETLETAPEVRFRPTDEAFIDPTSGRRMRVLVDPRTGERRYIAES
jgi:hypothetical protein